MLYLIFFVVFLYFFVDIYEGISGFRTDMLIEGIISGKLWTLQNLFIIFIVTIGMMILTKFATATLQTGVYVAMKDEKKK